MTDKEAQSKAQAIYELLDGIARGHMYYWETSGALHFNLRIPSVFISLDCLVIPTNDKYRIEVTSPVNIATTLILYEVDNIYSEKLYDTMIEIIKYLDDEWVKYNKDKKYKGWSGYSKAKIIKYDDHGRRISVS